MSSRPLANRPSGTGTYFDLKNTMPDNGSKKCFGNIAMIAHILFVLGSMALIVGPFLPWFTAGFVSASGMQKTGQAAFFLTLVGAAEAVFAVVGWARHCSASVLVHLVLGGVALSASMYYFFAFQDYVTEISPQFQMAATGPGLYVCIAASTMLLLGSIGVAHRHD